MNNQAIYLLLQENILIRTPKEIRNWIEQITCRLRKYAEPEVLSHSIAMAPKKVSKDSMLEPAESTLIQSRELYPGWQPECWSLVESIRILFNLSIEQGNHDADNIFCKAYKFTELSEKIAYLKGLFLYRWSNYHHTQALEATRSNTKSLFAAICLFNPYPQRYFLEGEWNNMILKSLTWNFSLNHIYGFEERKNAALSAAIGDYIEELKNASREIPTDVWKC